MNLSTQKLLAIAALICAIASYFVAGPLLLVAVILLAIALIV
jgi:hypothetical protein